jgi:phage baseplate assembly protein W
VSTEPGQLQVLFDPGFGPTYRGHGEVRLTTLLHAGTNALRHVSEWDDLSDLQRLPYPKLAELPERSKLYEPIRNIEVIQRAFGIGIHELIRQPISSRVLVLVDGQLGTAEPDYRRFEAAVIAAARDIARTARGQHLAKLDKVLKRTGLVISEQTS